MTSSYYQNIDPYHSTMWIENKNKNYFYDVFSTFHCFINLIQFSIDIKTNVKNPNSNMTSPYARKINNKVGK